MKRLTNILISAVVEPTAANDWLPANLPTTIISTACLKKEKIDELYGAFGYISVKLRSDWTHFNAYGY